MMTCETFGMSRPRPMTSVATSTRTSPRRNFSRTSSRMSCFRPLWMPSAWKPLSQRSLLRLSTCPFSLTKISTLLSASPAKTFSTCCLMREILSSSAFSQLRPSFSSTTTSWMMLSLALGTTSPPSSPSADQGRKSPPSAPAPLAPPMRMRTGGSAQNSQAKDCTVFGHVAEKKAIWRSGRTCDETVFMSSEKPRSSILSASSKTRYVTRRREVLPSFMQSSSRPGVATRMCEPSSPKDLSCCHFLPPP
mmetsp:Transcript_107814/g.287020  ORF Transcript_107814/g.287020 Transcript_107814/m.287020 type:complete len:249 (-) Transcript_107814:420-1166(-)